MQSSHASALVSSQATGISASGAPAPGGVQQKQHAQNDQNGGDLYPIILKLAAVLPPQAGEMPIAELLPRLQAASAEAFADVDKLAAAAQQVSRLSDDEANKWKERGNAEFQRGAAQQAVVTYTHGLLATESAAATATLLNNRSTALLKLGRHADACLDAHKAFVLKPDYTKALLRRGRTLVALGFTELGQKDVAAAEREAFSEANTEAEMTALFGDVAVGLVDLALPPRAVLRAKVGVERGGTGKGRGLVARERLDCGAVLEETPYALVARAETLLSVCSYCLQFTGCLYPGEPFRQHGTKSRGFFCSQACAEAAWTHYSERECSNAFFFCCPNDALLAWRLVQGERAFPQLAALEGFDESFDPVSHNSLGATHMRTLEGSHSKELPTGAGAAAAVGGYESVVACLALYMGAVATPLEAEHLRKAQRQILLNAFDVTCTLRLSVPSSSSTFSPGSNGGNGGDGGGEGIITSNSTARVGRALYAVGALLNHSCDPNCYASFINNPQGSSAKLVVRTIRPVMEGEELTIAYGGIDIFHFHSMRSRLQTLRERFGFICRCQACANQVDEPVPEATKDVYVKAADYYQKGRRMIRERQFDTAVTVLLQSYEMVMRYICPPPNKPQMMVPKTHDALALAYFHLGDRAKCVEHLKAALVTDIEVHGGNDNRVELINEFTRLAFVIAPPPAVVEKSDAVEKEEEVVVAEAQNEKRTYAEKAVALLKRFYAPSPMLDLQIAYTQSSYSKEK